MTQAVRVKYIKDYVNGTGTRLSELEIIAVAEKWLQALHYKYVHPKKFKTYQLEELYNELCLM
jgi:hypothetical protein